MSDDTTNDERRDGTVTTGERSDDTESGRTAESGRANASRRRVLRGVAAGSLAGVGGFGGVQAQDTTTEGEQGTTPEDGQTTTEGGGQRFFEEGTEVGVQEVATGMAAPTDFAQPEGDDRYFVTDQTGEVWVVAPDDGRRDEPFVNVSDRMVELGEFAGTYASQGQAYDERGLLGIEFHPQFGDNGRFYLHYSAPRTDDMPENWDHREIVSEFRASDDRTSADPGSERVLLDIPHPQYNHDAGPMAFGPDGYLYVPMGDGGGADDDMYGHVDDWYDDNAGGNGQDVTENLLGSVLRIDVDGGTAAQEGTATEQETAAEGTATGQETTAEGTTTAQAGDRPYGIPDDNPFAGDDAEGREEIYAWGLRNPFGISFDSDGRMFVADVGQNLFEEVNIVERGGNYGWNVKEGTHCFSTENPSQPPEQCPSGTPDDVRGGEQFGEPIVEYPHTYRDSLVGIAIVGGHFYEQNAVSELQGKYVFGDWTQDPAREQPAGRLLAATPREGQGEAETATEGDAATATDTAVGDGETTAMADGETVTDGETATGTETLGGKTATAEPAGPTPGPDEQVVPREDLWEMEELVVRGGFDYFVRQFGQNNEGEIFVLAGTEGIPEGDSGTVLQIVPPGEGDQGSETTQADGETTEANGTTTESS